MGIKLRLRSRGEHRLSVGHSCLVAAERLESRMLLAFAPVGDEFRVNTFIAHNQVNPSVAADADGDFVVTWESAVQDGSGFGIYAQRYGADGARQGIEFRVNTTTRLWQVSPSVAMDADGDFVVVWQNHENDFESDILARRYNAGGLPQGGEFVVNTMRVGDQGRPAIGMSAGGDFVIAWESFLHDGDGTGIVARRYTAAGDPLGSEISVNTTTAGGQFAPSVALNASGDFVIAWKGPGAGGPETIATSARRFSAAGVPLGDEFLVASARFGTGEAPALAMDTGGGFVVAWGTFSNQAGVNSGDVHARRYSETGVPRGGAFVVNETIPGAQTQPRAAVDADGDWVIAWTSFAAATGETDIYARRFGADGLPLGGDFLVNTAADGVQTTPAVAVDADGDLVVAWHSNAPGAIAFDVRAQRYRSIQPPAVTGVFLGSSTWSSRFRSSLPAAGIGSAAVGFSIPAATQLATVSWANLDQVSIRLSDDVLVGSVHLTVRGVNIPSYPVASFAYDPVTRTATWTLGRMIRNDKILLALSGGTGGVAAGGLLLDGEWTGNAGVPDAFPSGDGAPGGDFRFRVDFLPGDVNGDRVVNAIDALDIRRRQARRAGIGIGGFPAGYFATHDLNGDAAINSVDRALVRRAILSVLPASAPAAVSSAASPILGHAPTRRKLFTMSPE